MHLLLAINPVNETIGLPNCAYASIACTPCYALIDCENGIGFECCKQSLLCLGDYKLGCAMSGIVGWQAVALQQLIEDNQNFQYLGRAPPYGLLIFFLILLILGAVSLCCVSLLFLLFNSSQPQFHTLSLLRCPLHGIYISYSPSPQRPLA